MSTTSELQVKMEVKKTKAGQKSDVHRDPSYWECVDASHVSQMSRRSYSKASPSKLSNKSSRPLYLSLFPIFLHEYIGDIINV